MPKTLLVEAPAMPRTLVTGFSQRPKTQVLPASLTSFEAIAQVTSRGYFLLNSGNRMLLDHGDAIVFAR